MLCGLQIGGEWIDDPSRVKEEASCFFEKRFSEERW